jgi:polyisoprenoid-binding protein YceI
MSHSTTERILLSRSTRAGRCRVTSLAAGLALLVLAGLAPGRALAESYELTWQPADVEITFDLPATGHTVHGKAQARAGSFVVNLDDRSVTGAVVVDAGAIETGSKSRDKAMHHEVLETETYPTITFTARSYTGAIAREGSSDIGLEGVLAIHGEEHPMTIPVRISPAGERLGGSATFQIPFVEWGMHDPSILFLRVNKTIDVQVELAGAVTARRESAEAVQ